MQRARQFHRATTASNKRHSNLTPFAWLVMILVARRSKRSSGGFLQGTSTRFMGLIVLSMGVQFALTGYRAFMQ